MVLKSTMALTTPTRPQGINALLTSINATLEKQGATLKKQGATLQGCALARIVKDFGGPWDSQTC